MMEFVTVEVERGVQLSVRLYRPPEGNPSVLLKPCTLILVHQYSLLGGCQGLLKNLAGILASRGYNTMTFDQRGAGRSTGKSSLRGTSEVFDAVAVARWAASNIPTDCIVLVGSSAGAPIAGSAVDLVEQVKGYVGLGYPFGLFASILFGGHNKAILQSMKPKLFVMGTRDGFTSVRTLENKLKRAAGRAEKRLVPGVGHFQMEGPQYDVQMANFITEFAESLNEDS